jgi:hypothetical protein
MEVEQEAATETPTERPFKRMILWDDGHRQTLIGWYNPQTEQIFTANHGPSLPFVRVHGAMVSNKAHERRLAGVEKFKQSSP